MRILLGPMKAENEYQVRHPDRRLEDSFCFYDKDSGTLEEILASLPDGWKPDVIIHWSLEYYVPPKGIENAECMIVGIFGDWNLGACSIQNIGEAFDVLFADRRGCELLGNLGFDNVHYSRLWGYDPKQHYVMPGVERDIDILMMGNLNHVVQRERSYWLARVAKLSRKYNVLLTTGVYGEEYTRMMNRAKIVFNKSVGGGINMRAYETMACGALLFNEHENLEIRDIFTDREHCVLYQRDNLEDLVDYYLAPENTAERERIASAGTQLVPDFSDVNRMSELLDKVEALTSQQGSANSPGFVRKFKLMPAAEQELHRLHQAHNCNDGSLFGDLQQSLISLTAEAETSDNRTVAQASNAHAALLAEWGLRLPKDNHTTLFNESRSLFECALSVEPDYAAAQYNLGFLYHAYGFSVDGDLVLAEVLKRLDAEDFSADQLRGVIFPHRFERFDMEMEKVWGTFKKGTLEWGKAMKNIFKAHIFHTFACSALDRKSYHDAIEYSLEALKLVQDWGEAHYILACAHRSLVQIQEAHNSYKRVITCSPFHFAARQEDAQMLLDIGRAEEAATILDDLLAILNGCPFYDYLTQTVETKLFQAKMRASIERTQVPIRMLAMPNWNEPAHWKPLVRKYVEQYHHGDPISLMLPIIAKQHPEAETVLATLIEFLDQEMHTPMEAIADVILMTEPIDSVLTADNRPLADMLVLMDDCRELEIASRAGIPTLALANLDKAMKYADLKS